MQKLVTLGLALCACMAALSLHAAGSADAGTTPRFGVFTAVTGWTSGVARPDTSVTSGDCYEYEWQDADNVGNEHLVSEGLIV